VRSYLNAPNNSSIANQAHYTLAAHSLDELLAQAGALVRRHGVRHETQRGPTWSLNGVLLTWLDPEHDTTQLQQWTQADIDWYLDTFVAKRPENDPAQLAQPGVLLFPYTYAARSRFWDAGWGYLQAFIHASSQIIPSLAASREQFADFLDFLAAMGERLHLQTVLSLCALYAPPDQAAQPVQPWLLDQWLATPETVETLAGAWRRDLLAAAIEDIAATPQSRRAVVSSFCYPQLEEQLSPRMALPPYQFFQFLPGERAEPLHSIHLHRSLDVAGGAPLDFHHDLAWLREAGAVVGRPVGNISVIADNLHAYDMSDTMDSMDTMDEEAAKAGETIEHWLCRVTDGYRAGEGAPRTLLEQPLYRANIERIWARWRRTA